MNEMDLVDRQYMSNEHELPDRYLNSRKSINPIVTRPLFETETTPRLGRNFKQRKSVRLEEFLNRKEENDETEYESNDDGVETDADENPPSIYLRKESVWQEKNDKTYAGFKSARFDTASNDNSSKRTKNFDMQRTSSQSIKPGEYGYDATNNNKTEENFCSILLILISYFLIILFFPFSLCSCLKVCQEYERAVIFRLGRVLSDGSKGPGIFFILPCLDKYSIVDLRTVTFNVPPQEILTKDSVTVSVDAVVYFRIFNSVVSVINVEDAAKSTKLLGATTLRKILGTKSLQEILSDRESISTLLQSSLDDVTVYWGVKVERVEVKDVRLPVQLQKAMATEAEATRESKAKVIAAKSEKKASEALLEAAEILSESSIAVQLRYLQTLTQIASDRNSTIIFPLPIEILSFISNKSQKNSTSKQTNIDES